MTIQTVAEAIKELQGLPLESKIVIAYWTVHDVQFSFLEECEESGYAIGPVWDNTHATLELEVTAHYSSIHEGWGERVTQYLETGK